MAQKLAVDDQTISKELDDIKMEDNGNCIIVPVQLPKLKELCSNEN